MNHSDLIKSIADTIKQPQTVVKAVLDELAQHIQEAVQTDNELTLQGVAKFSSKERPAREGRNPATGETMHIKAKRVPEIKPLKALKDAANA